MYCTSLYVTDTVHICLNRMYNKLLYGKRRLQLISAQELSMFFLHYCQWSPWSVRQLQVELGLSSHLSMWNGRQRSVTMDGWKLMAPDAIAVLSYNTADGSIPKSSCSPHHYPSPSIHIFFLKTSNHKSSSDVSLISQMISWLTSCLQEGTLPAGWLHPAENTDALLQQEEENQSQSHYTLNYHHSPSSV